jgi:hypothetical protein
MPARMAKTPTRPSGLVQPLAGRSIVGQVLRRGREHEVALYLRNGEAWIADFVGTEGALVDVATWLRFNCAGARSELARARMVRECALPLLPDLVERIEALHALADIGT